MSVTKALQGVQYSSAEQIEDVVRQLNDIISARAILAPNGVLNELHVMTTSQRAPKLIARDIESALTAQLGLLVDYKKISIAQARFSQKSRVSPRGVGSNTGSKYEDQAARLQLSNVVLSIQGARAEATVVLKRNTNAYTGSAIGHASSHNQLRLVATAAIRAVEDVRTDDGTMLVEDVFTHQTVGDKTVVVVVVSILSERGEETLTGCALIRQDLWKAVAASSLDAINRFHSAKPVYDE